MVSAYLRRGLAAGLLAELLAGLFAFLVGEPVLDRAIALEEVFSRPIQKVGLFFATGLFGATAGAEHVAAAARLRTLGATSFVVDTEEGYVWLGMAGELAGAMGARCLEELRADSLVVFIERRRVA